MCKALAATSCLLCCENLCRPRLTLFVCHNNCRVVDAVEGHSTVLHDEDERGVQGGRGLWRASRRLHVLQYTSWFVDWTGQVASMQLGDSRWLTQTAVRTGGISAHWVFHVALSGSVDPCLGRLTVLMVYCCGSLALLKLLSLSVALYVSVTFGIEAVKVCSVAQVVWHSTRLSA